MAQIEANRKVEQKSNIMSAHETEADITLKWMVGVCNTNDAICCACARQNSNVIYFSPLTKFHQIHEIPNRAPNRHNNNNNNKKCSSKQKQLHKNANAIGVMPINKCASIIIRRIKPWKSKINENENNTNWIECKQQNCVYFFVCVHCAVEYDTGRRPVSGGERVNHRTRETKHQNL